MNVLIVSYNGGVKFKILIALLFHCFAVSLFWAPQVRAQLANPEGAVGPELPPDMAAPDVNPGQTVVCDHNYTGIAALFNFPNENPTPVNTIPCRNGSDTSGPGEPSNTVLRLWIDNASRNNTDKLTSYAQALGAGAPFPNGALVVFGVELNNLDEKWWGDPNASLEVAGARYAELFNMFSAQIADHNKFPVAPAPPDLYNAVYDPVRWLNGFMNGAYDSEQHRQLSGVNCNLVDYLVADVFDVETSRLPSQYNRTNSWKYLEDRVCGGTKKMIHFEGWGSDPSLNVKQQVAWLNETKLPDGVKTATTLIAPNCGTNRADGITWWYYINGKVYKSNGQEVDPDTCGATSDECTGIIIDPDDPFTPPANLNLTPEAYADCITMNLDEPTIFSNQYETTCSQQTISVGVSGDEYCYSRGCYANGSFQYQKDLTYVDLTKAEKSIPGISPLAQDYVNNITYKNIDEQPEANAAIIKLATSKQQFDDIKEYLAKLNSCLPNPQSIGCFWPKKIRGAKYDEAELLGAISDVGGVNSLEYDNYKEKLRHNPEILRAFIAVDPHIYTLLPAYHISSLDTKIAENDSLLALFKAFFARITEQKPILDVTEFKIFLGPLTPPEIAGTKGGIETLSSVMLPKAVQDENKRKEVANNAVIPTEGDYMGPYITRVGEIDDQFVQLLATKVNHDHPTCDANPDPEMSNLSEQPANQEVLKSLSGAVQLLAHFFHVDFEMNIPSGQSTKQQSQTAYLRDFTLTPTAHKQGTLESIYQIFTSKYQQEQDAGENQISETTKIDSATEFSQQQASRLGINQLGKEGTATAGTNNPDNKNVEYRISGIASTTPKRVFTPKALVSKTNCPLKYAPVFLKEAIPGCSVDGGSSYSSNDYSGAACTFSGGYPIASNKVKDIIVQAAKKYAPDNAEQLAGEMVAVMLAENCRSADPTTNLCSMSDAEYGQYFEPSIPYTSFYACTSGKNVTGRQGPFNVLAFYSTDGFDADYQNKCSIHDNIYAVAKQLVARGAKSPLTPTLNRDMSVSWTVGSTVPPVTSCQQAYSIGSRTSETKPVLTTTSSEYLQIKQELMNKYGDEYGASLAQSTYLKQQIVDNMRTGSNLPVTAEWMFAIADWCRAFDMVTSGRTPGTYTTSDAWPGKLSPVSISCK